MRKRITRKPHLAQNSPPGSKPPGSKRPGSKRPQASQVATIFWVLAALCYLLAFASSHSADDYNISVWLLPDLIWNQWTSGSFSLSAVSERGVLVAVAAAIFGAAWLLGRALLSFLVLGHDYPPQRLTGLERAVFSLSLGLSCLSTYTLLLGLLGWLQDRILFLTPLAVGLLLACWRIPRERGGGSEERGGSNERSARAESTGNDKGPTREGPAWEAAEGRNWRLLLCLVAAAFGIMILLAAMMPPWNFDVREYHLQAPKEWYLLGRVSFMPHNVYANMPLGAEMQALLAMILMPGDDNWWWGALAGKLVIAAFAPLTSLALYAAGKRFAHPLAGGVASLVYLSTPWVAQVSISGLIDVVVGHYFFVSAFAVLLWRTEIANAVPARAARGWLVVAGWLAGAAAACKYPALLLIVAPLAMLVSFPQGRSVTAQDPPPATPWRRWFAWKPAALFLLGAIIGCGPWHLKNLVLTGNPTYPLLVDVFGGETRTPAKDQQWKRAHQPPSDAWGKKYSWPQWWDSVSKVLWSSRWQSPLLWPLALAAVLARNQRRFVMPLALLVLFYLTGWWLVTHRIERFWVPLLPLLALLAGFGAQWSRSRFWRWLLLACLAVGCLYLLPLLARGLPLQADYRWLTPLTVLRADTENSPVHPTHRYLNEHLRDGSSVLLVGDAEPFDLRMPALYNTCFDDCQFERLVRGKTTAQILRVFKQQNITHVLVRWSELDRYRRPGNYGYSDYVTRQRVRQDLVKRRGVLRGIPLDQVDPEQAELFVVVTPNAGEGK